MSGNQDRGDVVESLACCFRVLLQNDRTKAAGCEDLIECRRIKSGRGGNTREDLWMADVLRPTEKGLEDRQVERPESLGVSLTDPRPSFQRRQRLAGIPRTDLGHVEDGRVFVLCHGRHPVRTVVVGESPVRPFDRHQHETPVADLETVAEFFSQATQANRCVVAPGSEVVRVDGEHFSHGVSCGIHRPRWLGHEQAARRKRALSPLCDLSAPPCSSGGVHRSATRT